MRDLRPPIPSALNGTLASRHLPLLVAWSVLAAQPAPAQTLPTWHVKLDHAIRPAEGSDGVLGNVSYLAVTSTGVVYVAERGAPRVTRYDAHGIFAGVVMSEGAGPREVREPEIAAQGDTLLVFDPQLARLTRLAPGGRMLD
ncbi:MAG: hypothetical protein ACREL5_13575, partial [Gemmatimonadales bacterium]